MTKEKVKVGAVVCLKSGGLPMTIEANLDSIKVKCVWFNYNNELCRDEFKIELLRKSKPRKF